MNTNYRRIFTNHEFSPSPLFSYLPLLAPHLRWPEGECPSPPFQGGVPVGRGGLGEGVGGVRLFVISVNQLIISENSFLRLVFRLNS